MTRRLHAVLLTVGLSLFAAPAYAALIISATIGGVDVCASDNNLGPCTWGATILDVDPALGSLRLNPQTIGGVFLEGTAAKATAGSVNILDSSSLRVRNDSGGVISATVAVSATDFVPPVNQAFASGSGTWQDTIGGSTISMEWYDDPNNAQGALTPATRPGVLLTTFFDSATPPVESFSTGTLGPFAVNDPNPFSMTLGFDISLQPGAELISRGMNEIKPQAVPEPGLLAVFGTALLSLAAWRRR